MKWYMNRTAAEHTPRVPMCRSFEYSTENTIERKMKRRIGVVWAVGLASVTSQA